jgi:hypothetical protein
LGIQIVPLQCKKFTLSTHFFKLIRIDIKHAFCSLTQAPVTSSVSTFDFGKKNHPS